LINSKDLDDYRDTNNKLNQELAHKITELDKSKDFILMTQSGLKEAQREHEVTLAKASENLQGRVDAIDSSMQSEVAKITQ